MESVIQIEGLIKYVKAESANTGKNFRLDLSESVTNRIFWETDPLRNPGIYSSFSGGWQEFDFLDFVDIISDFTKIFQFFSNGEIIDKSNAFVSQSNLNLLIVFKTDKNIKYKITIIGSLGLIKHERMEIKEAEE